MSNTTEAVCVIRFREGVGLAAGGTTYVGVTPSADSDDVACLWLRSLAPPWAAQDTYEVAVPLETLRDFAIGVLTLLEDVEGS